ncbi:MAG: efflux RND transporter periplasmic adaptor subunit [Bacteroidia bacterium]|nr:efflux RND transporter periplasmic adaptor subunit [Bacteroidia bacterium]
MSRTAVIIVLLALLAVIGGTGFYLYNKNQEPPVMYKTVKPFTTTIIKKTVATGSVVPRKEIEIKPQVSGLISKLYIEAGEIVKKGDLIATIRIIPDMVSLNNAENRVRRAKINLTNTKREFERNQGLFKDGVISEATFRQFEIDYENAQEENRAAADNLQLIKKGSTKSSGRIANTNVRATINGMILDVPVEEGNSVIEANTFNEGTTIATIANMDEMIFKGNVDESDVGRLKVGMPLVLTIGALETEKFDAELEYISPKGVEENGAIQFEIRARVKLKDGQFIRSGYSANGDIVLESRENVLAISESWVIFEKDSPYIEIEKGSQQFEKVPVKLGLSDGIQSEVLTGVDSSTKVKDPTSGFTPN